VGVRFTRNNRRIATWVACFAILLNACAPTVSRIIAAWDAQPIAWSETAAAAGFARIADALEGDHGKGHNHTKSHHGGHCPFCVTHAGSFGLAASEAFVVVAFASYGPPAPFSYQSARPLLPRAPEQPRAPPLFA
jgi:hypothetical protein